MIKIPYIVLDRDVFENTNDDTLVFLFGILSYDPDETGFCKAKLYINSEIVNSEKYKSLSAVYKNLLDTNYKDQVYSGTKTKYKIASNHRGEIFRFTIDEAIRFFQMPISVILENSLNDGYFMKAILKHFDRTGILIAYYNYGWIQFENAGGWPNIHNYILGKTKQLKMFANQRGTSPEKYLRCFVLIDSDKKFPTNQKADDKLTLERSLVSLNVQIHILEKRAMENYLPDDIFDNLKNLVPHEREYNDWKVLPSTENWLHTYRYLSDTQKDYLNHQTGFSRNRDKSKINRKDQIPEIRDLFQNLTNDQFDILDEGLKFPDYKSQISRQFNRDEYINSVSLLARCGGTEDKNEFLEIITKIGSLL